MDHKDYYRILGVSRNADEKEIKKAYRKLARQCHPDLHPGDQQAERRFREINEAYETLSDKDSRVRYDRFGANWKRAPSGAGGSAPTGPFDFNFSYSTMNDFDFSGFSDLFEDSLGGRRGARRNPFQSNAPPADRVEDLEVSLEEALRGTTRSFQVQRSQACSGCRGVGVTGQGRVCSRCRGRGEEKVQKTLEVKIPPGVTDGSKIRVRGEGDRGPAGSPAGDLFLRVVLKPGEGYEVKGHDLHRELWVPLYTAVLGGPVEFDTPGGRLTLKLPPETSGGAQFRLSGRGLPRGGNKPAGDLYVRVRLEVPSPLSDEERELFRRLADLRRGSQSQS
ncbi:MAG: J domain-containing protein [Armatimonadetes bacterium]|nr:J domain-containing protein [Armatimonadota bacterium]